MTRRHATLVALFGLLAPSASWAQETSTAPWHEAGGAELEYRGPGRSGPDPVVDTVRLGWFGPGDPDHRFGGDAWRGATLALEEENRAGGYEGTPFELLAAWSDDPWAGGAASLSRLVYDREVWAILGALDGASAHVAAQIALKSRVTLISSGSTDASANLASVPWFFSCLPSDAGQALRIAEALGEGRSFALAAATDHDSHAALVELRRVRDAASRAASVFVEFDPVESDLLPVASRLLEPEPSGVVVLAPAPAAARLVMALREGGFDGTILAGAPAASNAFLGAAGVSAEGVRVPLLWEPSDAWDAFTRAFETRWGERPDYLAAQSYDAVRLVAAAVREAGLNRARIRAAVRAASPWAGTAGVVRWDSLGRNARLVGLAVWQGRRLVTVEAPSAAAR